MPIYNKNSVGGILVSITQRIPIYIFYSLDSKLHIIIMTISSINLSPYSE